MSRIDPNDELDNLRAVPLEGRAAAVEELIRRLEIELDKTSPDAAAEPSN